MFRKSGIMNFRIVTRAGPEWGVPPATESCSLGAMGLFFGSRRGRAQQVIELARGDAYYSWLPIRGGATVSGARFAQRVATGAGAFVALLGATVMFGWFVDLDWLKTPVAGFSTMKFNTALGFVLSGLALLVRTRGDEAPGTTRGFSALAWATLVLGAFNILQYAAGVHLGMDELFVTDSEESTAPGRMSLLTAIGFALFGICVLLAGLRRPVADRVFTLMATLGFGSFYLTLSGYVYGVEVLYDPSPSTSVAIHTAFAFTWLFVGAIALRPDTGWAELWGYDGPPGRLLRALIPAATVLPLLLGWLGLRGELAGAYGPAGLASLLLIGGLASFAAVLWVSGRQSMHVDRTLRARERVCQTVLHSSLDAFVMTDAKGAILEWNEAAEEIIGIRRSDAVGQCLWKLILRQSEWTALQNEMRDRLNASEADRPSPRLFVGVGRERREILLEILTATHNGGDRRIFSHFIRDVTDQKAAETQLVQAQKMEAVGQLTGGLAHDFNNLLTVVSGNLELLTEHTDSEGRGFARSATEAADCAADLVRQLLAFARKQKLSPEWINVNQTVESMVGLLRRTLGAAIEITLKLDASSEPSLVDETQLKTTLLNLSLNARDAMPESSGRLTIETRDETLDDQYAAANPGVIQGDYLMIAVTDTGSGMSPGLIEHAFEPFFTTKHRGTGTGLGLSMAYGFVKQSRGHIKIYSELGYGTSVRIYLPRGKGEQVRPVPQENQPASIPSQNHHGGVVLIVEDHEIVRSFASASVQSLGYSVIHADAADEALKLLENGVHVDVLFSDVVMPGGMSGVELADQVSRRFPDIKILLTSGYTAETAPKLGEIGATTTFISKPYTRKDLAVALGALQDY